MENHFVEYLTKFNNVFPVGEAKQNRTIYQSAKKSLCEYMLVPACRSRCVEFFIVTIYATNARYILANIHVPDLCRIFTAEICVSKIILHLFWDLLSYFGDRLQ